METIEDVGVEVGVGMGGVRWGAGGWPTVYKVIANTLSF